MTSDEAIQIWTQAFGRAPHSLARLPTGMCHYVYRVGEGGETFILRVAKAENRELLAGSVYWLARLAQLGLPVPRLKRAELTHTPPYLVLNYIEGVDLGQVYAALDAQQRREIATELWAMQQKLASLESGQRFGHLGAPSQQGGYADWPSVIYAHLARSRTWMASGTLFDPILVERVERAVARFLPDLRSVRPQAFLDDATTKNLLIADGRITGIVDLDWLCFGDPLYHIALTRMALLAAGQAQDYVEFLLEAARATSRQRQIVDLYTLVFCVDFMGGAGMQFNQSTPPAVSAAERDALQTHYDKLLLQLEVGKSA